MQSNEDKETKRLTAEFLLSQSELKPTEVIEYPTPIISRGVQRIKRSDGTFLELEKPFGTLGNFSFLQAQPKHKKSFLVALLAGIYLGGSVNTAPEFIGHRDGREVLYFDTEQGNYHAQRSFRNAFKLAGQQHQKNFHTYALRPLDFKTRVEVIEYAILEKFENVGLVIIDGIIDLISDANDLKQSEEIVQKLLTWTAKANCHILTVIHTTGSSEKPTGHLGTFLERKCEMQLHLSKNETHKGHIDVKAKSTRGFTPDDFSFFVNEFGLPEISAFCYEDVENYLG